MHKSEYKAGKWRFIPKRSLNFWNIQILRIKYYAILLVLGCDFSLQSALQMQKCIVETCCGYLKHSSDSGEFVSKKNHGHTMRRTENKAGKWPFIPKITLNFQILRIQYYAILLVLAGDFSLQSAIRMQQCIVEPCCGYLKHFLDSGKCIGQKIRVVRLVETKISKKT